MQPEKSRLLLYCTNTITRFEYSLFGMNVYIHKTRQYIISLYSEKGGQLLSHSVGVYRVLKDVPYYIGSVACAELKKRHKINRPFLYNQEISKGLSRRALNFSWNCLACHFLLSPFSLSCFFFYYYLINCLQSTCAVGKWDFRYFRLTMNRKNTELNAQMLYNILSIYCLANTATQCLLQRACGSNCRLIYTRLICFVYILKEDGPNLYNEQQQF